ncbi:MAG TPA: glycosyltransferase family 4 protein [Firmicutes bacterium]|nr:glycosyltransferase family 4 protein [Bacillota bacterium]
MLEAECGSGTLETGRALSILYLTLQRTTEGQAGYAHVHEIVRGLRECGNTVHLVEPRVAGHHMVCHLLEMWRVLACFCWYLAVLRLDLVYVRQHPLSPIATMIARMAGLPVAVELNGPPGVVSLSWPGMGWLDPVAKLLARLELRLATGVVSVTPELARWADAHRGSNRRCATVIPNGANVELMKPIANPDVQQFGLEQGYYVVFVGALAGWQGIDDMLAAVDSPLWPQGVRLVICGGGREAAKVERAGARNSRIAYLGVVPYAKVPELISGSLAGLAPKTDPGGLFGAWAPLKVFEYLACGRPAIVSDLPGLRELIEYGEAGLTIPCGDPTAIALAVAWIAEHPEERERMGLRARTLAEARYSWRARAVDTHDFLCGLVLRRASNALGDNQ